MEAFVRKRHPLLSYRDPHPANVYRNDTRMRRQGMERRTHIRCPSPSLRQENGLRAHLYLQRAQFSAVGARLGRPHRRSVAVLSVSILAGNARKEAMAHFGSTSAIGFPAFGTSET